MPDTIIPRVKMFLSQVNEGRGEISDQLVEEFGEACKNLMRSRLQEKPRKYTIRMSGIGRPMCQQQMEKAGAERVNDSPWHPMKMLLGGMVEEAVTTIMKAAGVNVESEQEAVSLQVTPEVRVNGTLDVTIDGKVYDVKSASPYAFTNKFVPMGGFSSIVNDDPFGYVQQGYLYSEAKDMPFGGWIVVNKVDGEWAVCEPPMVDNSYRKKALSDAATNVNTITSDAPFRRCFGLIEETFYKKPTGNQYLDITCSYCPYKNTCWGNVTNAPVVKSKAKTPAYRWYVGEVKGLDEH